MTIYNGKNCGQAGTVLIQLNVTQAQFIVFYILSLLFEYFKLNVFISIQKDILTFFSPSCHLLNMIKEPTYLETQTKQGNILYLFSSFELLFDKLYDFVFITENIRMKKNKNQIYCYFGILIFCSLQKFLTNFNNRNLSLLNMGYSWEKSFTILHQIGKFPEITLIKRLDIAIWEYKRV